MNNILIDREKRLENIQSFFNKNKNKSLVVVKANIPGSNKNEPVSYHLINIFKHILINDYNYQFVSLIESWDGPYIFLSNDNKAINLKHQLIHIEEIHPLGRLIDLDYYLDSSKSISRDDLNLDNRKCFLCGDDAHACSRSKKHSIFELSDFIEKTFYEYIENKILKLVDLSILTELNLENKFGLVTPTSSGSHKDMDYNLMIVAKNSLNSYFQDIFKIGYNTKNLDTILSEVRNIGIDAENKMFAATNQVNCYKGIIFLMGIVLLSLGYTIKNNNNFDSIFDNIKIISKDILKDFDKYFDTVGAKLYHDHNITGIRGIVYNGLEIIKMHLNNKSFDDDILLHILIYYITNSDDTVFINRSKSFDNYLKHKEFFKNTNITNKYELYKLNEYAISHNLSFGGSADLLIVTIFMNFIKNFLY